MVSISSKKLIQKLRQKKYRDELGLFIVEGRKSIIEFLNEGYKLHSLYCIQNSFGVVSELVNYVSFSELKGFSSFDNPDDGLAVFHIKEKKLPEYNGVIVVLDKIRDPGNLGTIIRISDWFGAAAIVCSTDTANCYNAKVVQASMGSLSRMTVCYTNIAKFLQKSPLPVYGATLQGSSYYTHPLPKDCIIVMGNEANGISSEILELCTNFITIDKAKNSKAESLNVAIATAVLLSTIK